MERVVLFIVLVMAGLAFVVEAQSSVARDEWRSAAGSIAAATLIFAIVTFYALRVLKRR